MLHRRAFNAETSGYIGVFFVPKHSATFRCIGLLIMSKYVATPTCLLLILGLQPANERRRYKVTPSPIGRAQA